MGEEGGGGGGETEDTHSLCYSDGGTEFTERLWHTTYIW